MRIFVSSVVVAVSATVSLGQILNGSFESAPIPMPNRVGMNNLTDWVSANGQSLHERGVNNVSQIAAHSGEQFVSMGHNGAVGDTLSQVIPTAPGTIYTVSFYLHCIQGNAQQSVSCSAIASGGTLGGVEGMVSSVTQGWVNFSFDFQATQPLTQIRFIHSLGSTSANVALDSVTVVPAPATAAALVAGVVAGARRRRQG